MFPKPNIVKDVSRFAHFETKHLLSVTLKLKKYRTGCCFQHLAYKFEVTKLN